MLAYSQQSEVDTRNTIWYLGIDFGTTGISSVLLNYSTSQQYPIYWSNNSQITPNELRTVKPYFTTSNSSEKSFRLPAVTYLSPAESKRFGERSKPPFVVGLASTRANNQPGIVLQNFKPYLNIGIPYYCVKRDDWEPTLQLLDQQLSLYWVRHALQALLATLTPKSALPDAVSKVGAVGLESETLECALQQLEGVVLGYPMAWGDTYQFNLREAVLETKLVRHPEQIFFIEEAIASILAGLPNSHTVPNPDAVASSTQNTPWRGATLVINAGATTTEIALVDLPDDPKDLTYSDFYSYSLPYAGNAIDQDVFCQLLYPQLSVAQHQQLSLGNDLELPLPGQSERLRRDRLASLLQTPLGQALLKAAGYLKLILQHKDEFTLELGDNTWVVKRQDLEDKVIQPFIQQLNRELNALLIKTGKSEQGIYQVLCIGGTAAFGTLQKWIQHKLPLATLIQDTDSPTGNWVAAGLATLPLYPQVFNRVQQQYSDYFLLLELLRAFLETANNSVNRSYSIEEIMQQLERRGLNTSACYERIVRLVEGKLPAGLVPSIEDDSLLSHSSKQNFHYSTLTATPQLFSKQENQYRPNLDQQQYLRHYLDIVLSRTYQKFEEPLI